SDTFVPPELLPEWFVPAMELSPLTYFARGVRAATYRRPGTLASWTGSEPGIVGTDPYLNLVVLSALAVGFFAAGAYALPRTD
ncbi:ABC transporter permease, partial [Halobacteriales archaeon QS_1_68_44]